MSLLIHHISHIAEEIFNKIKDKSIARNILRINSDGSIICELCCIALIEYIIGKKSLLDYTKLSSPYGYITSGKIIYKYFKDK